MRAASGLSRRYFVGELFLSFRQSLIYSLLDLPLNAVFTAYLTTIPANEAVAILGNEDRLSLSSLWNFSCVQFHKGLSWLPAFLQMLFDLEA